MGGWGLCRGAGAVMLRSSNIGANENWTVERRNRFDRETLQPAATPACARLSRDGAADPGLLLDRGRFFWGVTAKTQRVLFSESMDQNSATPITAPDPFTFILPASGKLRRVACRDNRNDSKTNNNEVTRIRVRRLDLSGAQISVLMNGTTSPTLPFDVRNSDSDVGAVDEMIEVCALNGFGALCPWILNVTLEFALNLNGITAV